MTTAADALAGRGPAPTAPGPRRILGATLGAHVLHDGFADLLYVLLPVWQAEFGLALAQVGFLKTVYSGVMAAGQVPAGLVAERFGERGLLVAGTAAAAIGYLLIGWSGGFLGLVACLALGGMGASVQHPLGSALTARVGEGKRLRTALSVYNFSGDLGKMAFPAATAGLLMLMPWRETTTILGIAALACAAAILAVRGLPSRTTEPAPSANPAVANPAADSAAAPDGRGFPLLLSIAMIDSATRMGFLTFLPFLLQMKGADLPTIGIALTLIFTGGATGKLVCGWLGLKLGMVRATFLTEGLTAAGILVLLPLPLFAGLMVLPLIGVALNGTSSIIYGTVPELVAPERRQRAFSIFYTGGIGAGALAPILYGLASDLVDIPVMMVLIAAIVLVTLPLTWRLRPILRQIAAPA
jgi:MFS transporter, FSR family, fosmidomycin resistance protein